MHEVHVQLLDHFGMLEQHFRYERSGLQVATSLELEHVAFRADHRALAQPREQIARGCPIRGGTRAPGASGRTDAGLLFYSSS